MKKKKEKKNKDKEDEDEINSYFEEPKNIKISEECNKDDNKKKCCF